MDVVEDVPQLIVKDAAIECWFLAPPVITEKTGTVIESYHVEFESGYLRTILTLSSSLTISCVFD